MRPIFTSFYRPAGRSFKTPELKEWMHERQRKPDGNRRRADSLEGEKKSPANAGLSVRGQL